MGQERDDYADKDPPLGWLARIWGAAGAVAVVAWLIAVYLWVGWHTGGIDFGP